MMNFYRYYNGLLDNPEHGELIDQIKSGCYTPDLIIIENIIKKNAWLAIAYAHHYRGGRWVEAEPYIMKNPTCAYLYAKDSLKGRWREAEPYIKQGNYWTNYCLRFGV